MAIQEISALAQLAQASYANLSEGMSASDLIAALKSAVGSFTETQASEFASTQTVLLQYNDDAAVAGATGNSLSLTVFQGNDHRNGVRSCLLAPTR